jgi:hypothetical protein
VSKRLWDYRIVRYRSKPGFGLHEVYYDVDGLPQAMTEQPVTFATQIDTGARFIRRSLRLALTDAWTRPILDEPEEWPGKEPNK